MFGSTVIDVAIGMVFVYLLLSLLCSAINEYIELKLNYRAKNLWKGVQLLLNGKIDKGKEKPDMAADSPPEGSDLASQLYQHGLVRALFRDEHNLPSYIPSRTFALTLWNLASQKASELSSSSPDPAHVATTDLAQLKKVVGQLPNRELAQSLSTLIDEADGNFNRAVKNVEDWFDGAMDRASGWYKKRVQKILLIIGFATAVFINADTVNIAKALIQDKALRDVVVASAVQYNEQHSNNTNSANTNGGGVGTANANGQGAGANNANSGNANAGGGATQTPPSIQQARADLNALGLPLGWAFDKNITQDPLRGIPHRGDGKANVLGWLLLKFFGLFLTGLAISQGAPFWFDLLNKFMVIRSTVKPKEKSPEQPSKDKPAPKTEDSGREDDEEDEGKG